MGTRRVVSVSRRPTFPLIHPMEIIIPDLFQVCFDYKRKKINTYGTLRKKITPHKCKLLGCTVLGRDSPPWTQGSSLPGCFARTRVQLFSNATRSCLAQKGDMKEIHELGCLIFFFPPGPNAGSPLAKRERNETLK